MKRKVQRWMNKKSRGNADNRKAFGILAFSVSVFVFFVLAGRISWIVLHGKIQGTSLREKTEQLYKGSSVVHAKRGVIYDRYGNPIAENATSYSVFAVIIHTYKDGNKALYAEKKDFNVLASILHKELNLNESDVLKRLNDDTLPNGEKKFQVEFGSAGKNITVNKKQAIEKAMEQAGVKGLYFEEHPTRVYPNGKFASNFIGNAAPNEDGGNDIVGQTGLERAYNEVLSGVDGEVTFKRDVVGNPMPGTIQSEKKAKDGEDIYTTLDARLQSYMETLMDKVNKKYKPESIMSTLMDAKTGEILAMGQRPSFNPENMIMEKNRDNEEKWGNILVSEMYEPGSTMKLFTTAASINEGQFQPNVSYLAGKIKVYDKTIQDHDFPKNGQHSLTYAQALSWSSNVGMVHLEEKLGSKWGQYQDRFLFGQSTYSGLGTESSGILPSMSNPVDMAMSSFGQAINVTSFQMMRGYTAISNNGVMLQPHYVSKIVNQNKKTQRKAEPEVLGKPISSATANDLLGYMRGVVEDPRWGSARDFQGGNKTGLYKVPNMHISVKTGTAEIAEKDKPGYMTGELDHNNSVVVMAPSENPKYILYVSVKRPSIEPTYAMSEIINPLLKRAFESDEIPTKEGNYGISEIALKNYEGKSVAEAANSIRREILHPVILGDGDEVKQQSTMIGEKLLPNQKLLLRTNGNAIMPDVYGWNKKELKQLEEILNIRFEYTGKSGTAISQSVIEQSKIKVGQTITIGLSEE